MSLLKQFLDETSGAQGTQGAPTGGLQAATPYNKRANDFSLLRDIHGSEITAGDVVNHLQKVDDEEEEVETVAFGLETTDGQIVKVYVNAEEAEAFEEKMSQLLGKIDDIEEAIETLADEFDIVSVVRPGEDDHDDLAAQGEDPTEDPEDKNIENKLDEPLSDEDLAGEMDDKELVGDEDGEKKDKEEGDEESKEGEEDDESGEDSEEGDEEGKEKDDSDFGELDFDTDGDGLTGDSEGEDGEDNEDDNEEKPEGEEEDTEDNPEDSEEKPEGEEESEEETEEDPEADPEDEEETDEEDPEKDEKDKGKKKPKKDKKDKEVKEGSSLLQQVIALTENKKTKEVAKVHHHKPKAHKEEPKPHLPAKDTSSDNIFHMNLSKDEAELEKIFVTPMQQLIFRVALLLGVGAESIAVRKFKVRKNVKHVADNLQHQPQVRTVLNKLGHELAARRHEINRVDEATNEKGDANGEVYGSIKNQLNNEITKKIYALILELGIPEYLLTYKKTALKNRIKNLAGIAVKHSRIRNYLYQLLDLMKGAKKETKEVKEGLSVEVKEEPKEAKKHSLLEDFAKSTEYADLGAFNVVNMGSVGGVTLKVKDFSVDFSEANFLKLVKILGEGKAGVVKSENHGKISLIPIDSGKEFVMKKVNPRDSDSYPFGIKMSKKSIDRIVS